MSFRSIVVLVLVELSSGFAQPSGTFTATGFMITPRWGHTATLLNNGKVLIAGGQATDIPSSTPPLATAELYDPATGTFADAGKMTEPRVGHTAALLPDGRVLIAGGWNGLFFSPAEGSPEIYDPSTNRFTSTGSKFADPAVRVATLLNSGKVLMTGPLAGSLCGSTVTEPSSELYDPAMGTFSPTGGAPAISYCDPIPALLPNGRVLIVPGNGDSLAEIYDPATGFFNVTGWVNSFSIGGTATLLTTGRVLVTLTAPDCDGSLDHTALYDPATGQFTAAATMAYGACRPKGVTLSDGKVLIAGGSFAGPHSQVYDFASGTFRATGDMASGHTGHTATLLNDGTVLVAGGLQNIQDHVAVTVAEVYHPAVALPAPALLSLSGNGQGPGAILHANSHQIVSADNPAASGEALEIYLTGLLDGSVIPPQVAIGGRLAEVLFFGNAPGYTGLNQVNIQVPDGLAPGPAVPVRLNYMGRPSNEVTLAVR